MKRTIGLGAAALLAAAVAGCGTSAASPSSSANSAARGGLAGRGADGQLVKISGTTLVLNSTATGDVNVSYTTATTITQTSTGSFDDITVGLCARISGPRDSTGAVTVTSVALSHAVAGKCAVAAFVGGGGVGASGRAFPSGGAFPSGRAFPSGSARPGGFGGGAGLSGIVTAVSGTSVTIKEAAGTSVTETIPTTTTVTETDTVTPAALTLDSCVLAIGAKNSSGTVAATALTIEPAGPSGCFSGGRGGFGGGGGFGGRSGGGA